MTENNVSTVVCKMEIGHSRISCRVKDQELLALTVGKATLTRWCLDKQDKREIPWLAMKLLPDREKWM